MMASNNVAVLRGTCTQSGNDTTTALAIPTGVDVSRGDSGILIVGVAIEWHNPYSVAASDWTLAAVLSVPQTPSSYYRSDPDVIARCVWGLQNTGGVAVAVPVNAQQTYYLDNQRLTVAEDIYFSLVSSLTGVANVADICIAGH
jgi:hypothetical protein